jgi:putative phosphoribosyl transferase
MSILYAQEERNLVYIISQQENIFKDRREAGEILARELSHKFQLEADLIILGIPRGGLVVARTVSNYLGAPLGIALAAKLSSPDEPDFAIGGIAVNGDYFIDQHIKEWLSLDESFIERERKRKLELLIHRAKLYYSDLPPISLAGKSVIIVDDGLTTGSSILAASMYVRSQNPRLITIAVPVGSYSGVARLVEHADNIVCLYTPPGFYSISSSYRNFAQLTDSDLLADIKHNAGSNVGAHVL